MISRERFALALREIGSGQWEHFEHLASAFLVGDFPNLRTMASTSGDRGRDAELFTGTDPSTLVQYSVARDWKAKIRRTIRRVSDEFPGVSLLVYVTNQQIGSAADDLVKEIRQNDRVFLDIRDRSWFLDRVHHDRAREEAAEALARVIVDPLLSRDGLIERRPSPLSNNEMRAAVVHLELQWADDERMKGLNRTSYEALVRSVLRNTSSSDRMSREDIQRAIRDLLPSRGPEAERVVQQQVDRALKKLSSKRSGRRLIRHHEPVDEFCLTHEERQRLNAHLIEDDIQEQLLQEELQELVAEHSSLANDGRPVPDDEAGDLLRRSRKVLEQFLFGRGEAFAVAVKTGRYDNLGFEALHNLVNKNLADENYEGYASAQEIVENVVYEIVTQPGVAAQRHLRRIIDAYTLLAFLRETPDVQRAVKKLFSHGELWLDTNILLPLFAEQLNEENNRQFTSLILATRAAGLKLYITDGVLEELERQMNRALAFARTDNWQGTAPFMSKVYVSAGCTRQTLASWIEQFMGYERPEDDLAEFLREEFEIEKLGLQEHVDRIPEELRYAVDGAWTEIHEQRRSRVGDNRPVAILARHDAECYLGTIARRSSDKDSPFGYSSWWLTLDRAAFRLTSELRSRLVGRIPNSPVMSPDFLTNYLAIGPLRANIDKNQELTLPIALEHGMTEFLSPEIIREAERVREEFSTFSERRMRRHIRDLELPRSRGRVASTPLPLLPL